MKETKLTSVKILEKLYQNFKVAVVNSSMTLQKLANRSIFLYLNDREYRERLDVEDTLANVSGSKY